jgi:hypothetical protein
MRNTAVALIAAIVPVAALVACAPASPPPTSGDGAPAAPADDPPPTDDLPPVTHDAAPVTDPPPDEPIDIATNGCNGARWCGDLFGAQFVSNVDLVACGESCSIQQTQTAVEGCVLALSGAVGVAMEGSFPDSYLSFGSVAVGDSAEHVVRVENQGDTACTITGVSILGDAATVSAFSIVDPGLDVLAPGGFVDVPITLSPSAAGGLETALFYVPGDATAWLTLYGVSHALDDTSCRLVIDAQHAGGIELAATVGGGRSTAVRIDNAGAGGCRLLPFEVVGESFAAAPALSMFDDPLAPEPATALVAYPSTLPLDITDGVLAPGEHVVLDVEFAAPQTEGTTSGSLVVRAQASDDVTVSLSGTALPPPPSCECDENWGYGCTLNPEC